MKKFFTLPIVVSFFVSLLMLASVGVIPIRVSAIGLNPTATFTVSASSTSAIATGAVASLTPGQTVELNVGPPGTNSEWTSQIPLTLDSSGNFNVTIPSLTPSTQYSAQITYTGTDNSIGNEISFTTTAASTTSASSTNNPDLSLSFQLQNPLGATKDLPTFLTMLLNAVILILTPVVTIMLLYSGFLFVIARGNTEKLGEAKKALLYTVIGAAIILGAVALAAAIKSTVAQF